MQGVNNIMWQTNEVLHKHPQLVPGTLLSVAGCLVIHRHATVDPLEEENEYIDGHDHIKTFLALIIIQMLPLVALEMKIMSCADPVSLFCKFATPVTLVHAIFLSMRLCMYKMYDTNYVINSGVGLVGALLTLIKGFKISPWNFLQERNVWGIIFLALAAAIVTCVLDSYLLNPRYKEDWDNWTPHLDEFGHYNEPERIWIFIHSNFMSDLVATSNSYIELTAFIPAVWMVLSHNEKSFDDTDLVSSKRKATCFFLFLIGFYMMEDLTQAWVVWSETRAGSLGHLLHYALLCDFAFYILAHIYNTDKLVGALRKWLPADLAYAV